MVGMNWKEAEAERKKLRKTKPPKAELCKPFEVRNFRFFPCNWSRHLKAGYTYYLLTRNHRGQIHHELNSFVFKTKKECIEFTENNRYLSCVLA